MQQFSKAKTIKIFLFAFLLFVAGTTNAQVGIGIANPNPSAQLDVSSTTKGFLPPRMTQVQRDAIKNPAPGLIIWCTDCGLSGELQVHNGTSWAKTAGRTGTNYYVKESGDDTKDGSSDQNAWKTLAAVNDHIASFKPGDSILFQRGSFFFGPLYMKSSGTATNPIIFSAYGMGPKPVFTGAVQIWPGFPGADLGSVWNRISDKIWEYTDNLLNYYHIKGGLEENNFHVVDVANLILREKNSSESSFGERLMALDASNLKSQGQFWFDYSTGKFLLYSNSDPTHFYDSIQYILGFNALNFKDENKVIHSYLVFENLDFRYYGNYVVRQDASNCSFKNLDISFIGGSNLYPAEYNKDDLKRQGNGINFWDGDHDNTVTGCRIDNCYDAGISPQGYPINSWNHGGCGYNIYMRNNVISNCEYSFEFFYRDETHKAHDIYFENNTCINAGGGWAHSHSQRPDGANATQLRISNFSAPKSNIFIRNNIFYQATQGARAILLNFATDVSNMVLDYNDYYSTENEFIAVITNSADPIKNYNWKNWRDVIKQDLNSYNEDPLFVSKTDFHLQPGSPLIGKGIDVGYGKDIGAFLSEGAAIGNQQWMQKNLDVTTYRNGDPILEVEDPAVWDTLTRGAWCYYEHISNNGTIYGKLYNWYAVHDPRGLAPAGWHVASDEEWTSLTDNLGGVTVLFKDGGYEIKTAGGKLKEAGTSHWRAPNTDATNTIGFSALPGGKIEPEATFKSIHDIGSWWTSSEVDLSTALYREMHFENGSVYRWGFRKTAGLSVRCVKD